MPGAAARFLFACIACSGVPAPAAVLPPLVDGAALGAGWRIVGLPKQRAPLTRFSATVLDEVPALRIETSNAYGNLVHRLDRPAMLRSLRWRWRLDRANPEADLTTQAGDDVPLRVCLSFALPLAQLPFWERQRQRLAQSVAGEPLPTATLCWVWDSRLAAGTQIANAYTRRVRYIVLRGPPQPLAQWVDEERDVAADFQRAFGDESAALLPVDAVIVGADSDNTRSSSLGAVAALQAE